MLMINVKVGATLIITLITFHEFKFWAITGLAAANENRSEKTCMHCLKVILKKICIFLSWCIYISNFAQTTGRKYSQQ